MTRVATTRPAPNLTPEDDADRGQLDDRRRDVEQQEIEHHVDALGAALDDLGERAGAPLEVEAQRQIVDVAEDALGQPPGGVLPDPLEDGVAHIVEQHAAEARGGIGGDQGDGEADRRAPCPAVIRSIARLVGERHDQSGALGGEARGSPRRRRAPSAPARRPATDRGGSAAARPKPGSALPVASVASSVMFVAR